MRFNVEDPKRITPDWIVYMPQTSDRFEKDLEAAGMENNKEHVEIELVVIGYRCSSVFSGRD